jgi:hypothetical protein
MSLEALLILAIAIYAVYWLVQRFGTGTAPTPLEAKQPPPPAEEIDKDPPEPADPFLVKVQEARRRAEAELTEETNAHSKGLRTRFGEDVKLKEELATFARENGLDRALIAVAEEIRHYPSWSRRADFEKWNKLQLSEVSGEREGDEEYVEFMFNGTRYKIIKSASTGYDGDLYTDFSIFEKNEEMFSISCSSEYHEHGMSHSCLDVTAFRRRGNWAEALLLMRGRIDAESKKGSTDLSYLKADEIRSKFER